MSSTAEWATLESGTTEDRLVQWEATREAREHGDIASVTELLEAVGYRRPGRRRLNEIQARLRARGVEPGAVAASGADEDAVEEGMSNAMWKWQIETLASDD